jgi:DNA-binding transcriptional regulator YhcF (GntR family)
LSRSIIFSREVHIGRNSKKIKTVIASNIEQAALRGGQWTLTMRQYSQLINDLAIDYEILNKVLKELQQLGCIKLENMPNSELAADVPITEFIKEIPIHWIHVESTL